MRCIYIYIYLDLMPAEPITLGIHPEHLRLKECLCGFGSQCGTNYYYTSRSVPSSTGCA